MMKISSLRLVPLFLITELTLLWLPFPFDPPTFSLDLLIYNRARAKGYKHSRCLWIFPEDLISIIGKGKQARKTRLTLANASNTNYKHVAYKEESNLSSRSLLLQNAYLIDFGPIKNIFFFGPVHQATPNYFMYRCICLSKPTKFISRSTILYLSAISVIQEYN